MSAFCPHRLGSGLLRLAVSAALAVASTAFSDARLDLPRPAWAADFTVNQLADPGDGTCDGSCTLRDAILAANASAGADSIDFGVGGAIVLVSALPAITDGLTIDGSGFAVTVDAANAFRVLSATAPLTLTLLTLQNGNAAGDGGGAYFGSTTTISGVNFISNTTSAFGGGAYFSGPAWVTAATFERNTAPGSGGMGGGAIFFGPATLGSTSFVSNTASNSGGGVAFVTTASLIDTAFISNTATSSGGGAYWMSTATVSDSTFTANTSGFAGGGARFDNLATVTGTTFTNNKTSGGSGGGADFGGAAFLSDTTFSSNAADTNGGGALFAAAASLSGTTFISNTSRSAGGGAFIGSMATVTGTVFISNTARTSGGGAYLGSTAVLTGSTFISNTATASGGGAYFANTTTLSGVNFSNNAASTGGGARFNSAASLTGTTFFSNTASVAGGGARFNGPAMLSATTFDGNLADTGGGAYFANAASVADTSFIANLAAVNHGGGAYFGGTATVTGTTFASNAGNAGGGAYLADTATVTGTTFISNTADATGGGAHFGGVATVLSAAFAQNTASFNGGGAYFSRSATVSTTTFLTNTAMFGHGGGVSLNGANSLLQSNVLRANVAGASGGGLHVEAATEIQLNANIIMENSAADTGGGIYLDAGANAAMDNNVLAANLALSSNESTAISLAGTGTRLTGRHNTLASASAGDGLAFSAGGDSLEQSAVLINTIFDGYLVGARTGSISATIVLDGVLWSGVTTATVGTGITVTNASTGAAAFAAPAARDYHLTELSTARDAGVNSGLDSDFENDVRPIGFGPDLGADEYKQAQPVAPVAVDDTATIPEDSPAALSVLANDSDLNGDPLQVGAVGAPSSGGAVISGTTQIAYAPASNFNGISVFTYTVTDGVLTDTANVTVTITPVNDAPVASDDLAATLEDLPITLGVLPNDSDVEGSGLTVTAVALPSSGGAAISGTTQIVYTPALNFNGQAVFSYTISDGALTDTALVTVTVSPVNDAPTVSAIGDLTVTVGASTGPITFTVSDVESGGALAVSANSSNTSLVPITNIVLSGSGTNRMVNITPAANQSGQVTITLIVSDGSGGSVQDSFVLTVVYHRLFLPLVIH
jgi:CSLREA domain-containing protein